MQVDGTGCDVAVYIANSTKNVRILDPVIHDGTRAGIVVDTTSNTNCRESRSDREASPQS